MDNNESSLDVVSHGEYAQILSMLQSAHRKSVIAESHPQWSYGVTATRLIRGHPLIVGLNWGVNKNDKSYPEPTPADYPTKSFAELTSADLDSLIRLRPLLRTYLPNVPLAHIGQTNLYLFRTSRVSQLCETDRELCLGAFVELLRMVRPSLLIARSKGVSDVLQRLPGFGRRVEARRFQMTSKPGSAFIACRGDFVLDGLSGNWVAVPHPATPCRAEIREAAWQFCFPNAKP